MVSKALRHRNPAGFRPRQPGPRTEHHRCHQGCNGGARDHRGLRADPGLSRFFDHAVGYAVFPTVVKGAVGVGGASGSGVVFEKGKAVGKAHLTQGTIGAQIGGQTYSEVIFFETASALTDFKKGALALAAQVSAVAASAASKDAKYQDGVAVFTHEKGGLMAEASVGGQKFRFEPFGKK